MKGHETMEPGEHTPKEARRSPFFRTRGAILTPADLTLRDWPERARRASLTTLALHPFPKDVIAFVRSEAGERFLGTCGEVGLQVEYELHAMGELLPRELFRDEPDLFRMDGQGRRTPDSNLCVHSERALDIVVARAVEIAQVLRPTTHRYFYWGDDGKPWCKCSQCREFSETDQALLLEHRILEALRVDDAEAQLAHLAYLNTLEPPEKVAAQPGIFLEFAPIRRRYDTPLGDPDDARNRRQLQQLDANLAAFSPDTAQALEYWLDCSLFSKWRQPHVKIPWSRETFVADVDAYAARGIRNITTFAVYVDSDYIAEHGEPPVDEYGAVLRDWPAVGAPGT